MEINEVSGHVVDASHQIHNELGPGLVEKAYQRVLKHLLEQRGLRVEVQKSVDMTYRGLQVQDAFRVDLLVEGVVVVELKSTAAMAGVHQRQLLTYLRFMDLRVGLLINFGAGTWGKTVKRIANDAPDLKPLRRAPRTNEGTR